MIKKYGDLPEELRALIESGRTFYLRFKKRTNGEIRDMVARTGVKKHLRGGGPAYEAARYSLLTVWAFAYGHKDLQPGYKNIPLDGLINIKCGGKEWDFIHVNGLDSELDLFDALNDSKLEALFNITKREDRIRYLRAVNTDKETVKALFENTFGTSEIDDIYSEPEDTLENIKETYKLK